MIAAYKDVRDVTAGRLVRDLGQLPRVIVGSPPCQDISPAGKGAGIDGSRSMLYFEALRLVREVRPVWCCFENSHTLRTRGADRVLNELESDGYTAWPLVVGAWHAGAPHRRKRSWVIAADTSKARCGEGLRAPSRSKRSDSGQGKPKRHDCLSRNADMPGLEIGQSKRGDAQPEFPPVVGTIGQAWPAWNGTLEAHCGVDDGVPARLAIEAYGDAVVPQIAETIGRACASVFGMHGPVIDLFSGGACGWSLGLHRAGYEIAAICEIDDWRRDMAIAHHRGMAA